MDPKNILLLGIKKSVVAFDKVTGRELWSTSLGSGIVGDTFVTLLADERLVYAHTKGELFCLELFSGSILWQNPLTGRGYGLASLALPGGPQTGMPLVEQKRLQEASARQSGAS